MQLWIDKHKPENSEQFIGNRKVVEKLRHWISNFPPGTALMLCGSTGIGKTLLVEIIAKENNLQLLIADLDRIDKEYVEELTGSSRNRVLFQKGRVILIDDVETVSGRSRGTIPAIKGLIKQSKFPVILITSDPYSPKIRSLKDDCELVKFDKIPSPSIAKALGDICKVEAITADKEALKSLSRFCQGDFRSAINDLQIVCLNKKELMVEDLTALGYREKELAVFNSLQTMFHSRSLSAGRNAIMQTGEDSDEIFWWIENNLAQELLSKKEIQEGYDLLSSVDMLRNKVSKQQNWRFKGIASDLMSGISILKESHTGFVMYKPPQRILMLGRTKARRAAIKAICEKLSGKLHSSSKVIKESHLPYLRFILKKNPELGKELGLGKDELKLLDF